MRTRVELALFAAAWAVYVFDIAAGLVVAGLGYSVGRAISARQAPLGARRLTEPSYAG